MTPVHSRARIVRPQSTRHQDQTIVSRVPLSARGTNRATTRKVATVAASVIFALVLTLPKELLVNVTSVLALTVDGQEPFLYSTVDYTDYCQKAGDPPYEPQRGNPLYGTHFCTYLEFLGWLHHVQTLCAITAVRQTDQYDSETGRDAVLRAANCTEYTSKQMALRRCYEEGSDCEGGHPIFRCQPVKRKRPLLRDAFLQHYQTAYPKLVKWVQRPLPRGPYPPFKLCGNTL